MFVNIISFLLHFIFLSLTIPQLVIGAGIGSQCPQYVNDEIQQCVQPVALYAKVLNQRDNTSTENNQNSQFGQALQLPKIGGEVFKELCRLIKDFEACVEPHRKKCPKHITINLIEASYGFLCNAGYKTFMNSAECLMELDQRPSVKHCHDETLRDIEKANIESGITMPIKLDRMCEALNFFSGCVRHPIRHNCGLEAWQVIFRVLKDTTKTLMPACQFTGTSTKIAHNRHHSKPTPSNSEAGNLAKPPSVDPREKPEKADIHLTNLGIPESISYNRETSDHRNPSFTEEKEERQQQFAEEDVIITEEHASFSQLEGKPESVPSSAASAFGQFFSFIFLFHAYIFYNLVI